MNPIVVGIFLIFMGVTFGLMAAGTYLESHNSVVNRPTYSLIKYFSLGRNEPFAIPSTGIAALMLIITGLACIVGMIDIPANTGQ